MIEWEYSRNMLTHEGYVRTRGDDGVEGFFVFIRPTDLRRNIYNKERMKSGYDLFKDKRDSNVVKHAKTVKELKEYVERNYL